MASRAGNPVLEDDIARFRQVRAESAARGFISGEEAARAQDVEAAAANAPKVTKFLHNLPANVTRGVADAAINSMGLMEDVSRALAQGARQSEEREAAESGKPLGKDVPSAEEIAHTALPPEIALGLKYTRDLLPEYTDTDDRVAQSAAQFFIPFAAWSKAIGVTRALGPVAKVAKAALAEAATVASSFAPHQGRFADLLRAADTDNRLVNAYVDYLATDENEGEAEGRFKNVVDSLATSAALGSVLYIGGKAMRADWRAIADRAMEPGPMPGSPKSQRGSLDFTADTAPPKAPPATEAADVGQVTTARALRLSEANLGDYDLGADYMPNFDRMTTADDVKAVIAETAERNKGAITEARRGVITNEQLKGLAADLDVNEDVVRKVMERESGGVLNPETILAARQVLNASADRLLTMAKKIREGGATDLDRIAFRRQFEFHADYQRQFMGARAETGRALNAFAIPAGTNAEQVTRLKNIVESLHGTDTDALAGMLGKIDSVEGIGKLTRDYTRSRVMGVVQELFVNSILSGVKTHIINTTGNILFQGMNVAERALAARIGKFMSGDEHVAVGEASALVYGMIDGWRDALRLAGRALRSGEAVDAAAKYETQTRRAISSRNLLPPDAPVGLARAVDALGTVIRVPTERVMLPVDEFFKAIASRAELSRQAYLDAMKAAQANPMTPEEIAEHIRKFMANPPEAATDAATAYARYSTFQTAQSPAIASISRGLNMIPGARIIAPFINTPMNLLKAGLGERSPLAVFSADFRAAVREGGPRRDLALARVSMGTATAAAVASAAASGLITGGGPQDPKARKILEETGWQPYSIAVPDSSTGKASYVSYARAEPLAYVIGATADAVEMLSYADYDDEQKTEAENFNTLVASIVAGVANNTMSKTFMSGVTDFSEMLGDPKRYASGWLQNMGGSMVPYSSLRRDLARIQDPYIREAWTFTDKMRASSGIPGWSEGLPPKRDFFGEPIRYRGGSFLGTLSPFPDSQGTTEPVINEIGRLMDKTREVPLSMPGRRVDGMLLEVEEYDQLVRIARTEPIFDGSTFKQALRELISSDAYKSPVTTDDYRVTLVKQVQRRGDEAAKALLEERNARYAARITNWRLRKNRRLYGALAGAQ